MKLLVRSAILVTAAAMIPLVPTAAHADSVGHRDGSGDVGSVAYDPATGNVTPTPTTPEPAVTRGDITNVRVAHRDRVVKVTLRFRDLARAGFAQVHEFAFVTPTRTRLVFVEAGPGSWGGKATMRKPGGKKIACSVGRKIDYARNTVVVKVPRSCLGRPRAVKVGAATLIGNGSKVYFDDGYAVGGAFTDPFALSPKVRR